MSISPDPKPHPAPISLDEARRRRQRQRANDGRPDRIELVTADLKADVDHYLDELRRRDRDAVMWHLRVSDVNEGRALGVGLEFDWPMSGDVRPRHGRLYARGTDL